MAMYLWLIGFFSLLMAIPDFWFYKKMKQKHFFVWFRWLSLLPFVLFVCLFFLIRFGLRNSGNYMLTSIASWVFIALMLIYFPKYFYMLFYCINHLYNRLFKTHTNVFKIVGFSLGVFWCLIVMYGVVVTRDDFKLKKTVVEVSGLPKGFEGYKIIVLADFHLGNWNNKYEIMNPILKIVNGQNADLIVFAGDMINNYQEETYGWESYFRQLKCNSGIKYAVLGNHDYGDYTNWDSEKDKMDNLEKTKQNIRELGFRLLLNENDKLISKGDTITVVGVENYGSRHFRMYCDLPKALEGSDEKQMKLLISHDPTHWDNEVVGFEPSIFLTIAGHTHGGQIGLSSFGMKISPASLIFNEWDGLYRRDKQYLYVNRGIGYVGIPIRLGIPPEITLIELRGKP